MELTVIDGEMNVEPTARRTLSVTETGWGGAVRMELGSTPLVRHISWRNRDAQWSGGEWWLDMSGGVPTFGGDGGGSYAAVVWDAPGEEDWQPPVGLTARRLESGNISVKIDGRSSPDGGKCYLLTPVGWFIVQPRASPAGIELELPAVPVRPGRARLIAWQRAFTNWYERFSRLGTPMVGETAVLLRQVHEDYLRGDLNRPQYYALLGALQQANGHRGALANQVVLYCVIDAEDDSSNLSAEVLRLTANLEGLDG
jgi:hypothetical protein